MAIILDTELEISGSSGVFREIGVVGFTHSAADSGVLDVIVGTGNNNKRRRRIVDEGGGDEEVEEAEEADGTSASAGPDLLVVLGPDVMTKILSYLDARSVALSLLVSRGWHGMASNDQLWSPMCKELWIGKARIPRLSLLPSLSNMEIYSSAMQDGKRVCIRREDLSDHAWNLHFSIV